MSFSSGIPPSASPARREQGRPVAVEHAEVDCAPARPRVAVCVATFQRPRMLRALLDSLARLTFTGPPPDLRVVIVDNDVAASARQVVDAARDLFEAPVRYEVEPERNIAVARNRGVDAALALDADWIAFIDDDEVATPDWLDQLLTAQARFGAPILAGAVAADLCAEAPAWARAGFFDSPPRRTGTDPQLANTNNALVCARLLRGVPGPFSPEFGQTGGSDSLLFMGLARAGARIVWCEEAVVRESVPPSRLTRRWLLRRAFRTGNCAIWCERALTVPRLRVPARLARATARLGLGIAGLVPGLLAGPAPALRALWNVSYGVGALTAALGYRYVEYRDVHGS